MGSNPTPRTKTEALWLIWACFWVPSLLYVFWLTARQRAMMQTRLMSTLLSRNDSANSCGILKWMRFPSERWGILLRVILSRPLFPFSSVPCAYILSPRRCHCTLFFWNFQLSFLSVPLAGLSVPYFSFHLSLDSSIRRRKSESTLVRRSFMFGMRQCPPM